MQFSKILDFYFRNGLYQSEHDYAEKFHHLQFFTIYPKIDIELIHEYCSLRTLMGVKNATINREITIARSAINYYNRHQQANIRNPFNGFNLFEADFIPRFLSDDECKKLLQVCEQYPNPTFYAYVLLLLNTGCRSSELLKLEWQNVNLADKHIIIRNSLSKNKKTIYKPLNYQALQAFDNLAYIHPQYVFCNPKTDLHYKTFRRAWLWAIDTANMGHIRIHDLRHTFASLLVRRGVPLYHVSQLLGHSDTRITQRYAHLSGDNLADVVGLIPAF